MASEDQRSNLSKWLRGKTGTALYGVFSALVIFFLFHQVSKRTEFFTATERFVGDSLFRMCEPEMDEINRKVSDRSCIIAFDEDSQAVIGRWPWKRYVHADVLGKLEQFSPRRIMIDLLFVNPEQPPEYLMNFLDVDDQIKNKIASLFSDMDFAMATILSNRPNVYLDVQLIDRPRQDLPPDYLERIALNEKQILKDAVPAKDTENVLVFSSLEPVLTDYIMNARPAAINAPQDIDGKIRRWPLYYGYMKNDGTAWYLPSAVLQLIKDYYYVGTGSVQYLAGKVVLRNACVPEIDPRTSCTRVSLCSFSSLTGQMARLAPPADYSYNANLGRLLTSGTGTGLVSNGSAPFVVHVVRGSDGKARILDGWEVIGAARSVKADKVNVVWYREADVEIPTVSAGCFYINYGGTEGNYYEDTETGAQRIFSRVQTESYSRMYLYPPIPDIPDLDKQGKIDTNEYDIAALEAWFLGYCQGRAEEIKKQAYHKLEKKADDPEALLAYMNARPEGGRYFLYNEFFVRNEPKPGMLGSLYGKYPEFAESMKQDTRYYLTEGQLVAALRDFYREEFTKYLGKYVFAGGTSLGLGDIQQTPYRAMFGIHVIVNAFNTLATGNILKKTADMPRLDTMLLFVVCLAGGLVYSFMNVRFSWIVLVVSLGGIFAATRYTFDNMNILPSASPMILGNLCTFVSVLVFKLVTEERDRQFLHQTFGTYLAPEIIEDMYKNRAMPALGGESRRATAYFTDIVGFSTFSEKLSPPHLLELLNEYLSSMTGVLTSDKGTLDKYIGDAIVAFFGAPTELPDHAMRACRTALKMQANLHVLRQKWSREKMPEGGPERNGKNVPPGEWAPGDKWPKVVHDIKMRIGVNTGDIVVGNMGSHLRMNYTMMGDAVNLAARLEAAAKQYGVYILASESTIKSDAHGEGGAPGKVEDFVAVRFIDRVTVVGRSEPVNIYELIDLMPLISESERALIELYTEGMKNYFARSWNLALQYFKESEKLERFRDGKITPSELLISRCQQYRITPPVAQGQEWDGVYRLTKK
ncbi:MAG: adenylate/guanylate cyclase domain-containing protein [Kiritimatiellae bacterium]|nr:adenylate/guanylate cyclase domain-containing protein [Kiritimatiellia bacterium]MDD5521827.1 adenylate/guanylate cyclase domain-containing protein [Kiritimatiellia bacterium]